MKRIAVRSGLVLLCLVVATTLAVKWFTGSPETSAPAIRNVLLISLDTCRADHLGSYGFPPPPMSVSTTAISPHIDAVAAEGTLFENVISTVPQTLPAHSSMLTGTIPPYHGVHDNTGYLADPPNVTLAEILKAAGFATGAAISAFVLDHQFGLDQGFDDYHDHFREPLAGDHGKERRGGETTQVALEWIEAHRDQRFFYFLHYYDPHTTYDPPEPFASRFAGNPYAGEIAYTDHCIGQVVAQLKALDLYEETLLIITADHGEMLGEHGERMHTYFIYQAAIKVPLILRVPGRRAPARVKPIAGLIDIVPTVCGLLGLAPPEAVQGVDLFAGETSKTTERHLFCESLTPTQYRANALLGIVADRYKYIQTTRPELYDLVEDPAESTNLVESHFRLAETMQATLARMLEDAVRDKSADATGNMDPQTIEKLESLGYAGGTVDEDFSFDQGLEDPKDLLPYHALWEDLVMAYSRGKFDRVEAIAQAMIRARPSLVLPYEKLGLIAMERRDYDNAIAAFEKILAIEPEHRIANQKRGLAFLGKGDVDAAIGVFDRLIHRVEQGDDRHPKEAVEPYMNRGLAYLRKGDSDRALADFDQAVELDPRHAEAYNNRAAIHVRRGDVAAAMHDFDRALELDPLNAVTWRSRAAVHLRQDDTHSAIRDYDQAVALAPGDPAGYMKRGMVFLRRRDYRSAARDFSEAITLDPNLVAAYNYRGLAQVNRGASDEGIVDFTRVIGLAPDFLEAYQNRGVAYFRKGRVDEAVADFTRVIEMNPRSPDGYTLRSRAYKKKGDRVRAEQDAAKARELTR